MFERINQYRTEKELPLIKLSRALSYVARLHVQDLSNNHPDTSICNLHSWSNKGSWTACCYQAYIPKQECMHHKPRELTNYTARGYELAFWDMIKAVPDSAIIVWQHTRESNDMLLSRNKWSDKTWRAIGIGIEGQYAVAWFGQRTDLEPIPEICGNLKPKIILSDKPSIKKAKQKTDDLLILSDKTNRYYLIFGSYDREKDALKEVKKYIRKGFENARVIVSRDKFRVTLSNHPSLDEAKIAKAKLEKKYEEVWIVKF